MKEEKREEGCERDVQIRAHGIGGVSAGIAGAFPRGDRVTCREPKPLLHPDYSLERNRPTEGAPSPSAVLSWLRRSAARVSILGAQPLSSEREVDGKGRALPPGPVARNPTAVSLDGGFHEAQPEPEPAL